MTISHYVLEGLGRSHPEFGTLRRIRATIDLPSRHVRAGDLGGWLAVDDATELSGRAWLAGEAVLADGARASDEALLEGRALVVGGSEVFGRAQISDEAVVSSHSRVRGHGRMRERSILIEGSALAGYATLRDDVVAGGGVSLSGDLVLRGDAVVAGPADLADHRDIVLCGPWAQRTSLLAAFRVRDGSLWATSEHGRGRLLDVLDSLQASPEEFVAPVLDDLEARAVRLFVEALLGEHETPGRMDGIEQ